jgi:hypothetical protein
MTQQPLFTPTAQGEISARLLARRDDPVTSKAAASKTAKSLPEKQWWALCWLRAFGPGTTRELAERSPNPTTTHYDLARRLPELERKGLARTTGEVRDGARVWESVNSAKESDDAT